MVSWLPIFFQIVQALPGIVQLIQSETGKSAIQAAEDVLAHLTPGLENSPVLGPASPVTGVVAPHDQING
jgi:hypothetical protein